MRLAGGVPFTLLWPIYVGQVMSIVDLPLAPRHGSRQRSETGRSQLGRAPPLARLHPFLLLGADAVLAARIELDPW